MSAVDRIQTAKYTSPKGNKFEFIYESVSVEVEKKTTEFTFPEKDGAFIQDLGRAGRRYPFTLYFNGADYDITADNFLLALEEVGVGLLEHPRYGNKNVVPTGSIKRTDDLTGGVNQAVFEVVFSETIEDLTFPADSINDSDSIKILSDNMQESASKEFADRIKTKNISEELALKELSEYSVSLLKDSFSDFVKKSDKINSSFQSVLSSYSSNISNILSNVSSVISQAILISRIPSQIETTIDGFVDLYGKLITSKIDLLFTPDNSNNPANEFLMESTLLQADLMALCESVLNAEITTRPQAIKTSESILNLYDGIIRFRDNNNTVLEIIDTPDTYALLTDLIATTTRYLIKESFNLPKEIIVKLQNARNVIEFLSSVGLNVESDLDNFIMWNDLTADTIELLPKDLEVVYYG